MTRPTTLCYLSHTASLAGGGEHSLLELMAFVREHASVRVVLICPEGPLAEKARSMPGVKHERLEFVTLYRTARPWKLMHFAAGYLRSTLRLRQTLRRLAPTLLHANSAPSAMYAVGASVATGIPVVWHMRDIQPRSASFRTLLPLIGRRATRVIAISNAVRDNLASFGIDTAKITVVHNRVRRPFLHGGDTLRADLNIPSDVPVLATIGELLDRKGQLTAVRALAAVRERRPDAVMILCGGVNERTGYEARLRAEVAAFGLADAVHFLGARDDVGPVFDAADVVVVASNEEPFGRVVVEGMFARRPLVATRVGGIPELVRDGAEALLVPPGDPRSMADAIERILGDVSLRHTLIDGASMRAASDFSWDAPPGRLLTDLYNGLVNG